MQIPCNAAIDLTGITKEASDLIASMTTYDYDIGIIGGGAAGLTVSSGAAQLGAKTLLIEKEPALGGDCLHYGCVPSKTLIKTAHVRHLLSRASQFGLPACELPPVDFAHVAARIQSVIAAIQQHDSVDRFCKLGVQVEFGRPRFIDEHSVSLGNRTYSAKSWVIATGSSPAIPLIKGLDHTPFLTNRELFSLSQLPTSLAILGAGPIAIEMAQAFCRLGSQVHVIQRSAQILTREDRDVADLVMAELAREGVRFHLQAQVTEVKETPHGRQVVFTDQAGQERALEVDQILVAMGRTPNVGDLGLDRIGVAHDHKGIAVDQRLRSSQPHIFAPGDVNGSYMFTHAAGYEGGVVVANAVFRLPRKADYTFLPWCTYTHPEVASVGMNEKAAQAAGLDYTVWSEEFAANDRAVAEGESVGRIKLLLNDRERPLGVQIIGPRAGDLLGEWIAMLNGGLKLTTLAASVHPYPSLAEINKKVVSNFLAGKIFSETIKKGLKFFFSLKGGGNPCSRL